MTIFRNALHLNRRAAMLAAGAVLALSVATPTFAQYKTDAWGSKFMYGAYSTRVSSALLGTRYRDLIAGLSDPRADPAVLATQVANVREAYRRLSEQEVRELLTVRTPSIFEEARSVVPDDAANRAFMLEMRDPRNQAAYEPVDHLLTPDGFRSAALQFSTHRGLYNQAFGIPQNTPASVINAYIAGIRNVEFDVLETSDNVNIVIHDIVTNRLDGSYSAPPKYVKKWMLADLRATHEDILNPLGAAPATEKTGVNNLVTTERFLDVVNAATTERPGEGSVMTLYADARNYAPVSLLRLFANRPELGRNVVTKIYPFEMGGGLTNLLQAYAERYTRGDTRAAAAEIARANPNVLLALGGAPSESTEEVLLAPSLGAGAVNFSWDDFRRISPSLPFSSSRGVADPSNVMRGQTVFTQDELAAIDAKTFLFTRWVMDFAAVSNVRVLQTILLPSLQTIIATGNQAEYAAMSAKDAADNRILSAVTDNFNEIYRMVMTRRLQVTLHTPTGDVNLADRWRGTKFGSSDRYPDYQLRATASGPISVVASFYYGMPGTVGRKDRESYSAYRMRSTEAITSQIAEMQRNNLPFSYLTTDLPEDLRAIYMGTPGWPRDIVYKPGGLIKAGTPASDKAPKWATELWGDYRRRPGFNDDLNAIEELVRQRDVLDRSITRLNAYNATYATVPGVLVDKGALAAIGDPRPYFAGPLTTLYDRGMAKLKADRAKVVAELTPRVERFVKEYRFNPDGTPGPFLRNAASLTIAEPVPEP